MKRSTTSPKPVGPAVLTRSKSVSATGGAGRASKKNPDAASQEPEGAPDAASVTAAAPPPPAPAAAPAGAASNPAAEPPAAAPAGAASSPAAKPPAAAPAGAASNPAAKPPAAAPEGAASNRLNPPAAGVGAGGADGAGTTHGAAAAVTTQCVSSSDAEAGGEEDNFLESYWVIEHEGEDVHPGLPLDDWTTGWGLPVGSRVMTLFACEDADKGAARDTYFVGTVCSSTAEGIVVDYDDGSQETHLRDNNGPLGLKFVRRCIHSQAYKAALRAHPTQRPPVGPQRRPRIPLKSLKMYERATVQYNGTTVACRLMQRHAGPGVDTATHLLMIDTA